MPTYSYACTTCEHRFDAVQAFTEDALTTCPQCTGPLRKLFNSVGVVFKGSGFYRTDSRDNGGKSSKGESSSAEKPSEKAAAPEKSSSASAPTSAASSTSASSSSTSSTPATTSS